MSSSKNSDQWIVPGGGVEPEESSTVAAVREVVEEAGVRGKIDRCVGIFEVYTKKKILLGLDFYLYYLISKDMWINIHYFYDFLEFFLFSVDRIQKESIALQFMS